MNSVFLRNENSPLQQQKKEIILHPYDARAYQRFSERLYDLGLFDQATDQLRLSQQIQNLSSRNVLGITTDNAILAEIHASYLDALQTTYDFWKQVTADKPDYRDGYLQLASVAYRMDQLDEATSSLDTALQLDPNNTVIRRMRDVIAVSR